MKLNFTNMRVPDDGWGVERYYIAVNRKDGTVRSPMNDDQINGRCGPAGGLCRLARGARAVR